MTASDPTVEFFFLYPDVRPPQLASPDLGGSISARAARVCSPMTEANGFGWYIYPPADFAVRWDGRSAEWSLLEENEPTWWRSLNGGRASLLPEGRNLLKNVSDDRRDSLDIFEKYGGIPFIEADPRNGSMLEIITGLLARTSPGWSLLVRDVPNWPRFGQYEVIEGIVETDWYRSYIPTMIRLIDQHRVVRFHRNLPIMAVQPIPRVALDAGRREPVTKAGISEFPQDVWQEFVDWRRRKQDPARSAFYAREQRQRRKTPRRNEPESSELAYPLRTANS